MTDHTEAYQALSKLRKQQQREGVLPHWFKSAGYDLFVKSYLHEATNWNEQIARICDTAAKFAPRHLPENPFGKTWSAVFQYLVNHNYMVLPTPTLANTGTSRGLSVSCSGQYIGDSIDSFYSNLHESAVLSKLGFGTSGYFGDIRYRGSPISSGGVASGVYPVLEDYWTMANKVSQSGVRRGSFAGYIPISHADFTEVVHNVKANPDGKHLGINISEQEAYDIENHKSEILVKNFQKLLELRMTGRGYIAMQDNINNTQPEMYKVRGLSNKSQGLCSEICLHQDDEHTYSCILLSMNAVTYDQWKNTKAVFFAQVFLDCMVSEFIHSAENIKGMEKIIRHTKKGRAVGLGITGLHTYMQSQNMVFGEWDSRIFNRNIYKYLHNESVAASKWLAEQLGEPEWCVGTGLRNTHRTAQMPNKSSSLIFGQVSEGINPITGNVFNQRVSTGEVFRINPEFIKLLRKYNKFTDDVLASVSAFNGSCQHLDFLSEHDKAVFRTAFEIPQHDVINMAEQRQPFIDQSQSLNLFLPQNATARYVAELHIRAIQSKLLKNLYYINTVNADYKILESCSVCAS